MPCSWVICCNWDTGLRKAVFEKETILYSTTLHKSFKKSQTPEIENHPNLPEQKYYKEYNRILTFSTNSAILILELRQSIQTSLVSK